MNYRFRLLLSNHLKRSRPHRRTRGFTLIELQIAIVLAFVVTVPLFGFMLNVLNTDQQQQARATSEGEIQSAVDFIAQDLDQAVYIYDNDALTNNSNTSASSISGIQDQIPPVVGTTGCKSPTYTCTPVLVFWKREVIQNILPISTTSNCTSNPNNCNDTFVYSLVAYYLIKGNGTGETWSNAARISRFEILDGVYVTDPNNSNKYLTIKSPSQGFKLFDLNLPYSNTQQKLTRWTYSGTAYNTPAFTLVDFIDPGTTGSNPDCSKVSSNAKLTSAGGFYVCVDSATTVAQIYIRGNALFRLNNATANNCTTNSSYCLTTSVQIKGRGFLSSN